MPLKVRSGAERIVNAELEVVIRMPTVLDAADAGGGPSLKAFGRSLFDWSRLRLRSQHLTNGDSAGSLEAASWRFTNEKARSRALRSFAAGCLRRQRSSGAYPLD
jgi:hypothetical protein